MFGYYNDLPAEDSQKRSPAEIRKPYWIVWDPDYKRLIRWQSMVPSVILADGFVYLIDEDNVTVGEISNGYCYFKARHMKYRVIPD